MVAANAQPLQKAEPADTFCSRFGCGAQNVSVSEADPWEVHSPALRPRSVAYNGFELEHGVCVRGQAGAAVKENIFESTGVGDAQ